LCQFSIAWHILESHASECNGNNNNNNNNNGDTTKGGGYEAPTKLLRTTPTTTTTCHSDETGKKPSDKTRQQPELEQQNNEQQPSSIITTKAINNIISPQLAPVFQFKKKGEEIEGQQQQLQQQLRPHSYEPIPGLYVYENFITEEEESMILRGVDVDDILPWKLARFNGKHIGKRWGVHCNLRDRRVDALEHPLPNVLQEIVLPKLKGLLFPSTIKVARTMKDFTPNEANSIDYRRKQGHWLQAHIDDRKLSKEPIANLSLAGDCYMTFRNVAKGYRNNLSVPEQQRVLLKRRCLQILTGKARYDFSHGISNRDLLSDRRVSITMRESPLTGHVCPVRNSRR